MNRRILTMIPVALLACSTPVTQVSSPAPTAPTVTAETDATLLRLEDRRQYDEETIQRWASDPRPERRRRVAIALARIGSATFEDLDGDGWQNENEPQAGTSILLALTADPDPGVRAAAAFALGETGELRGAEALFAMAHESDGPVAARAAEAISKLVPRVPFARYEGLLDPDMPAEARRIAARFLFRFGSDQATGNAALLLDTTDQELRREAAYSLSRHAIPQARRRVEALLAEPDVLTRSYAARALGRIASAASASALLTAAEEPHAWVRTNALRALGSILDADASALGAEEIARIGAVAMKLSSDPDVGTSIAAIELAGRVGSRNPSIRDHLLELAQSTSSWQRETAVLWLTRSFGIDSLEPLGQLDDQWTIVRMIEGSSTLDSGRPVRAKFASHPNPSIRAAAIANIPTPPSVEDLRLIRSALDDSDPVVRATAIGFVPDVFPREALQLLEAAEAGARRDEMNDARLAAIDALAKVEQPDHEQWLRGLLADTDPVVRRDAAEQLATLTGRKPQYTPLPIERPLSDYVEIARWAARPHIASIVLPRGELRIALRSDEAPMTSWNFARLASEGYFSGTTFMRVVPNFVIQGGDPRNDMSGGPGYAIRDEINMIEYARGAVGMALSGPDTGGSQFFVTHSPQPHLDGGYTVFGHVVGGRGTVIDRIERGDRVTSVTLRESSWTQLEIDKVAGIPLPTLIGEMTPEVLMHLVPEYPERREGYAPDSDIVSYMASLIQVGDRVTVVLGTWCHDSQREVPRFLRILDELRSFGVEIPVTYIAVDREKEEPAALIEGLDIEMVATFIYFRDGREIGRIVETPDGPLEDHLLRIVSGQ